MLFFHCFTTLLRGSKGNHGRRDLTNQVNERCKKSLDTDHVTAKTALNRNWIELTGNKSKNLPLKLIKPAFTLHRYSVYKQYVNVIKWDLTHGLSYWICAHILTGWILVEPEFRLLIAVLSTLKSVMCCAEFFCVKCVEHNLRTSHHRHIYDCFTASILHWICRYVYDLIPYQSSHC